MFMHFLWGKPLDNDSSQSWHQQWSQGRLSKSIINKQFLFFLQSVDSWVFRKQGKIVRVEADSQSETWFQNSRSNKRQSL